jgi:cysteine desulfurase
MFWKQRAKEARIYADAAAATPLSPAARAELARLLELYGNPSALHKEALAAREELEQARASVAASIGAHADEIVFTSGGTEGNNLAIYGALRPLLKNGPVHAIVSSIEHPSVLEPLYALQEEGLELTELPVSETGRVSPEDVRDAITERTAFVSVQFVNSEVGTIEPIKEIAKEIRHVKKMRELRPLYFHCDASQAPLWKTVNVEKLGVDMLVLDGQKISGPKGVGALYIRRGATLVAQQLGGGQERGLRSGTENVALAGSFAVALAEAQATNDANAAQVSVVRNFLLQEILKVLPDAQVNGAIGDERVANNVHISIPHLDGEMAVIALDALGVAASTRSACDASEEEPSHVLVAMQLPPKRIKGAIRLTLLPSATKSDAIAIVKALQEVAQRYRIMA